MVCHCSRHLFPIICRKLKIEASLLLLTHEKSNEPLLMIDFTSCPYIYATLLQKWIWSVTILEYTQCTSLGDLVHKKHLIDIDARSKLEEERIHRQDEIDYIMAERVVAENMKKRTTTKKTRTKKVRIRSRSLLSHASQDESLAQIAEFVKKPTKDLPRTRTKSASNGVASMVSLNEDDGKEFFFSKEATSRKRQQSSPLEFQKEGDKQQHFSSIFYARNSPIGVCLQS